MDDPRVIDAIVVAYVALRVTIVLTISSFLILKAMAFRRAGRFGDMLSKSNVLVAIAYLGTILLLVGLDFFRTWPWVLGISLAVMIYVVKAGRELRNLYGSWKLVFHEAHLTLYEIRDAWRAEPLGMKIALALLGLEFWIAVALTEVKGVPRELTLPTMLVQMTPTPPPTATPVSSRPSGARLNVPEATRPRPAPIEGAAPTPAVEDNSP